MKTSLVGVISCSPAPFCCCGGRQSDVREHLQTSFNRGVRALSIAVICERLLTAKEKELKAAEEQKTLREKEERERLEELRKQEEKERKIEEEKQIALKFFFVLHFLLLLLASYFLNQTDNPIL